MTTKVSEKRQSRSRSKRLSNALLKVTTPSFPVWHTKEPKLVFANQQFCDDPKTGLAAFGPVALDSTPRMAIRLGIIGDGDSIQLLRNWIERAKNKIHAGLNSKGVPFDSAFAPSFPGFCLDGPYQCDIEIDEKLVVTLTEREINLICEGVDYPSRTKLAVDMYSEKLCVLADKEPNPDVVVLAMPKDLENAIGHDARANQKGPIKLTRLQKRDRRKLEADEKRGQGRLDFGDLEAPEEQEDPSNRFRDFHNSVKAHAMRSKLPTQLVWHSTLANTKSKEDPATMAWNFYTALYYKAGNVPWRLQVGTARTCFVGITFYRESADPNSPTRTCLAQAFSETGEGLVLRGERVTWDKSRDKKPHLSREDSKAILERVLELYAKHFDEKPNRVVIHKTSRYWPEELEGFQSALGDVHSYDFLALDRRGIRFFRLGQEPPIRGTVIQLGSRNYLIYTQGYVPFMRQYPGPRIPYPLEVVEHHGDSSADRVCSEILALTKLNWNSCKYSISDPITISFARRVSTIIKELPEDIEPATKYHQYM